MGQVYLARQRSLDREVAVKTLKAGTSADAAALLREARVAGALEHPGVVPVHALGLDEEDRPLLVMKRVEGVDWSALLEDPESPGWGDRPRDRLVAHLEILGRVCETLELAHSRRVVHRDIKPDNVRVGRFGEVYLMDWGIALRLDDAAEPELLGTPAYMAPEMVTGDAVDGRTDVYLLGATLHEILTGRRRHDGPSVIMALASAIRSAPVAYDAAVPASLAALANAATARDPAARPPTVRAFREEIGTFLRHRALSGIADAALSRLGELEALLGAGTVPDLRTAYRLAHEARFGFTQCLREHPRHAPSQAGLRRCVMAEVEIELRQGHEESAEALLAGLDPPAPALAERVEETKRRAASRRREGERLRALDHDLDPAVAVKERSQALGLIAALAFTILTVVFGTGIGPRMTATALFGVGLFLLAFVLGVGFALRRGVVANLFNRRLAALIGLALLATTVNRGFGALQDEPFPAVLSRDLLIFATVAGAGAATLVTNAWTVAGAAVSFLCYVVARLRPGLVSHAFWIGMSCELVALLAVMRRRIREAREPARPPQAKD